MTLSHHHPRVKTLNYSPMTRFVTLILFCGSLFMARPALAQAAAPKTYGFEPTSFYTTYSAIWEPVLRLQTGDTVRTRTFDNDRDAKATRYGVGGNPPTGPFYIGGALPGDTLVLVVEWLRKDY